LTNTTKPKQRFFMAKQGNSELDKFLAEIDRLRKKSEGTSPQPAKAKAKAVPVAKPVAQPAKAPKRTRVEEAPPSPPVVTQPRSVSSGSPIQTFVVTPSVPTVAPVAAPQPVASTPAIATFQAAATVSKRTVSQSNVGRSISTLLANKQTLASAMALQTVLGPPRCRQ
jgi:hypothetical protein